MKANKLQESITAINGVEGRMFGRVASTDGKRYVNQQWKATRPAASYGKGYMITVKLRFDDECKNGHQTFSITGDIYKPGARDSEMGGCIHDEIAKYFPELKPLIKWHLVSTDGPMHYIPNTVYLASDADHNGLRAGESRQIRNGKTGQLAWKLVVVDASGAEIEKPAAYVDSAERPACDARFQYVPWMQVGQGKARDLKGARSVAVWPEATDEQLTLPKAELTKLLQDRLPALIAAFRADMEAAGFEWECEA